MGMTVTFKNKHTGELLVHEDVNYITPSDSLFSTSGTGVHFNDNTYCLVSGDTFDFVSASV